LAEELVVSFKIGTPLFANKFVDVFNKAVVEIPSTQFAISSSGKYDDVCVFAKGEVGFEQRYIEGTTT
jgi:hypothetical protein